MHRDSTDLSRLLTQMQLTIFMSADVPTGMPTVVDPDFEQFDHGPGGRITFTSQVGRCTGYDVQAVYEGINDWNASIVFPKATATRALPIPPLRYVPVHASHVRTGVLIPSLPAPFPRGFPAAQSSLPFQHEFGRAQLAAESATRNGGRFSVCALSGSTTKSMTSLNQEVQTPLPGPRRIVSHRASRGTMSSTTRSVRLSKRIGLNLFHLENNLMGFQVGLLHDTCS